MEFIKSLDLKNNWSTHLSKAQSLRKKYADRIPVIIDRANTYTPKLLKNQYLVPGDFTVSQIMTTARKHMPDLTPEKALFIFVGREDKIIPSSSALISSLYCEHQDKSGYLIILASVENTFGAEDTENK